MLLDEPEITEPRESSKAGGAKVLGAQDDGAAAMLT